MRLNAKRMFGFAVVSTVPVAFAWFCMRSLNETMAIKDYSYIPLIPVVSFYVAYLQRKRIFCRTSPGWKLGYVLLLGGLACFTVGQVNLFGMGRENIFSVEMLGIVLAWTGTFSFFFGSTALRAALFPSLFLLFMIPLPEPFLSQTIYLLQEGSATVTAFLFNLSGVPFLQHGFDFSLPGVTIRIAEECSGIRSTLVLVMMCVLAGHLFLHKSRNKIVLCALAIPFSIFKNGLRIVTLSILALYVNTDFLQGRLHQYGGMVFFAAAFVPLVFFLWAFGRNEHATSKQDHFGDC